MRYQLAGMNFDFEISRVDCISARAILLIMLFLSVNIFSFVVLGCRIRLHRFLTITLFTLLSFRFETMAGIRHVMQCLIEPFYVCIRINVKGLV